MSYIFGFMVIVGIFASVIFGNTSELSLALTESAADAVTLIISMTGMMCVFMGIMEVAKESGLADKITAFLSKILKYVFVDLKKDSKAYTYICMNVSANMLGLSNAATPMGLKAMSELAKENQDGVASDSMISFVVLNTASVQIVPTTVCAMRAACGSKAPFEIIVCVWITSVTALLSGLVCARILSKARRKKCTL